MEPNLGLRLPVQAVVSRELVTDQGSENAVGVQAAQTACDNLTGLAQEMCYAVVYGVDM
jgi:hypothetical protein